MPIVPITAVLTPPTVDMEQQAFDNATSLFLQQISVLKTQFNANIEQLNAGFANSINAIAKANDIQNYVIPTGIAYTPTEVDSLIAPLLEHSTTNGVQGSTQFNVASAFSQQQTSGYIHIKVALRVGVDVGMFHFNLRGHAFGQSSVLDNQFVGYCAGQGGIVSTGVKGVDSPSFYTSSDGYLVCRVTLTSIYFTTAVVDTMYVGDGKEFTKNDISIQINNTSEI